MTAAKIRYVCDQCGKEHEGLPALSFAEPAAYWAVPEQERESRTSLTSDTCVIDGNAFYVRTVLEIPIIGEQEFFEWGVWGSLSKQNFDRYNDTFLDGDQSKLGPLFSWFASRLPGYAETCGIPTNLLPQDGRCRPLVAFKDTESHALACDKRNGITFERALAFARPTLPSH